MSASRRFLGRLTQASVPISAVPPDPTELAYERMLANTEQALELADNRLLRAQAKTEAILAQLRDRRRWSGLSVEDAVSAMKHELFEIHLIVTGKAK